MPDTEQLQDHNKLQRRYYEDRTRAGNFRVEVGETPYVLSHVDRMIEAAQLEPGQRILDVGCGMGKFTLPLARKGYTVDAMDLSPVFLDALSEAAGDVSVPVYEGDLLDPPAQLLGQYDRVIGFFMLHHLADIPKAFAGIKSLLKPGGRIAFIEPNPLCPLYYLQVTFAPNMSWAAEKGILKLGKARTLETLAATGFRSSQVDRNGIAPPIVRNSRVGDAVDNVFDKVKPLRPMAAFQVITAEL